MSGVAATAPALSPAQIASLARSAGFPESSLPMAVAVALLESGGRPDAHGDVDNPKPGCGSYGLWQINSCPVRDKAGGHPRYGTNPSALYDPLTNAKSAYTISSGGTNWGPWSTKAAAVVKARTIDIGAGNTAPVGGGMGGAGSSSTGAGTGSTGGVQNFGATDLLAGSTWVRVAYFILGLGLAIAGVTLVLSDVTLNAVDTLA